METRRATAATLAVAAVAFVAAAALVVSGGDLVKAGPWFVASGTFLFAAYYVWRQRPDSSASLWFAAVAVAFTGTQLLDGATAITASDPDLHWALPWVALIQQLGVTAASVVTAHFLGRFPDGRIQERSHRRALVALWWLLALPPVLLVTHPTVLLPSYLGLPEVANPLHVAALEPIGAVVAVAVMASQAAFVVGVVVLVRRYRRGTEALRQRIRWLLLPALLAAFAVAVDVLAPALSPDFAGSTAMEVIGGAVWLTALFSLPTAVAIALTRPRLIDVDALLRGSLVYGVLWTLIGLAYVGAAAGLGLVAGQRFPVEIAIGLTVLATLAFQPARRRLERAADRWVFGERLGRYEALRRLGQTLEDSVDHGDLLQRLADTVQRGLGLTWVLVTAEGGGAPTLEALAGTPPDGEPEPSEVVPIVDDAEVVGRIACGAPGGRPIADEDRELLEALARQAGLAVRSLRLTEELSDNVEALRRRTSQLEESRTRLVRVQEEERRRLERDLHDGVQQDVVALIGQVGLARRRLRRGEVDGSEVLDEVQAELGRILSVLRELGRGIHPTVLTDRGLVEAVEAQAARSPVPVRVIADRVVRGERYGAHVEGAAFFTVCEALANVLKHAQATDAEVRLTRRNGALQVSVHDSGRGFDQRQVARGGLRNLAERIEALGGRLSVDSRPGSGTTVTAELALGRAVAGG